MREHPSIARCGPMHVLAALAICGVTIATVGCVLEVPLSPSPEAPVARYVLETPMPKLPQLEHRVDLGAAVVEAEVTSASVEPTSITDFGGSSSSSWGPAHTTKPGYRWMIVRAYGTNTSWDYPPVDLGDHSATLTCRGRLVQFDAGGGGGTTSALYRGLTRSGRPTMSVKNINNAQAAFEGVYQVPSTPATYTLTWSLGKVGTARLSFRF